MPAPRVIRTQRSSAALALALVAGGVVWAVAGGRGALGSAAAHGGATGPAPAAVRAAGDGVPLDFTQGEPLAGTALPGSWQTVVNGDDVLSLVLEGGVLWAGTRAGGLVRWDRQAGTYTQFLRPQDPLPSNTIFDVAVDEAGRKWLATSRGLTMFDDKDTPDRGDDVWRTFTHGNTSGGLPSDDVRAVAPRGNEVWVGAHQIQDVATGDWSLGGLGRLNHNGTPTQDDDTWAAVATYDNTRQELPNGTDILGLVSDNVNALAFTPAGRLWIGTESYRVHDTDTDKWPAVAGGLSALDTKGTADPADDVWAGFSCEDDPLVVSCHVLDLALESNGWMWAATRGRGAMFFQASGNFIGTDGDQRYASRDGLPDNDVRAIAFGPSGSNVAYIGTPSGLAVIEHKGTLRNKADDVLKILDAGTGLSRDLVQALATSGPDAWVGTGPQLGVGGGIDHVGAGPAVLGHLVTSVAGGGKAPPSNFIRAIAFGAAGSAWAGHVWFGTGSWEQRLFGEGVVDIDTRATTSLADDVWHHYTTVGTDNNAAAPWTGLAGDNAQAIVADGERMWFGSVPSTWNATTQIYDDGGLAVFEGGRWTNRRHPATGPGLSNNAVARLSRGCDGRLWIGTGSDWQGGSGVDVLSAAGGTHTPSGDTWVHYAFPQLASDQLTSVSARCAPDVVWTGSQHQSRGGGPSDGGAARFDVAAGTWQVYDVTNGLTTYSGDRVKGEAMSVLAGPAGAAWVGTYGTEDTTEAALIQTRPYWPAVLNAFNGTTWTAQVFEGAGWVSSIARDGLGRLWAGLSRGGAARDSLDAENWRDDRTVPGLVMQDEDGWHILDVDTTGLPANDVSVVAVAPDDSIWIGTEGWGLAVYRREAPAPTATPTSGAPTPTATATRTATPVRTPSSSPTRPTGGVTPSATHPPGGWAYEAFLPWVFQSRR